MKLYKYLLISCFCIFITSCHNKSLEYDAAGVFEVTEIVVSAKGNGELKEFNIDEGDLVEANTQLGVIDTTQLYLRKLQLKASMSGLGNRRSNVSTQIAATKEQIATLEKEKKRFENLVKANAANQKQLDDINAQLNVYHKQLAAQYETINNSNNSLADDRLSLEMQVDQIDDQIRNSVITSPIRGTILAKYAEPGEFATQGKPLFKVANIDQMYLRAYVTASQLTAAKLNQNVKIYADMGDSDRREYDGRISWISDKAEFTPKTIQTRDERANLVYAVKIVIENDGYVKKGMYGEVQF